MIIGNDPGRPNGANLTSHHNACVGVQIKKQENVSENVPKVSVTQGDRATELLAEDAKFTPLSGPKRFDEISPHRKQLSGRCRSGSTQGDASPTNFCTFAVSPPRSVAGLRRSTFLSMVDDPTP